MQKIIATILMTGFAVACQPTSDKISEHEISEDVHSHSDGDKDNESYLIPGLDHGLMQSPINILSSELGSGDKHNVTVNFTGEINKVENLGHTVQLDFEPGNTITADGETYEFKQLHFHTPSEHLIDGVTFPMEMHVVNVMPGTEEDEMPKYLVIAFLIKMGKESPFLSQFIEEIPKEGETSDIDLNMVKGSELLRVTTDDLLNACYHYMGSLTTPPYTESVHWLVHKKIFEASPDQITRINQIEGDNARHIQASREREVLTE